MIKAGNRLSCGWVEIKAALRKDLAMTLFVDGETVATGKAHALIGSLPGDGLQIGADTISPVGEYEVKNFFKGLIRNVGITCGE